MSIGQLNTKEAVSAAQAHKMIEQNQQNSKFKVVDVRFSLERCLSRIPNTEHVPVGDIQERLGEFNKENTYLIYCRSGARSRTATNTLRRNGINAINITGGMNNWDYETQSCNCSIY